MDRDVTGLHAAQRHRQRHYRQRFSTARTSKYVTIDPMNLKDCAELLRFEQDQLLN
jgi:hypothetical protein